MFFLSSRRLSLTTIRRQVIGINRKVPTCHGRMVPYVNFDNAASTPALKSVVNKVQEFLQWYSGVHRGTGFKSQVATAAYDETHTSVGNFFGADPQYYTVIFGKNTTEAINKLAYRLQLAPRDIVLITLMEHHSNDLPWRNKARVLRVKVDENGMLDTADLTNKLRSYRQAIKLVAVSGASNVTGWINDIHTIAAEAHAYGIPILVDAAQLAPHRPINLLSPDNPQHIDFLAFSAHKMYAPFGSGVLIGPKHVFSRGDPEYAGGGTVEIVTTRSVEWAEPPAREEAGSPNVVGAIALAGTLSVLEKLGMDNIARYEQVLTDYAVSKIMAIPGLKIYGSTEREDPHRLGVISFTMKDYPHALIAAILAHMGGIGVRSGCFCAQPYVHHILQLDGRKLAQWHSRRRAGQEKDLPGLVRISFGMYNTHREVDRLVQVLKEIASHPPDYWLKHMEWNSSTGCYQPRGKTPSVQKCFSLDCLSTFL